MRLSLDGCIDLMGGHHPPDDPDQAGFYLQMLYRNIGLAHGHKFQLRCKLLAGTIPSELWGIDPLRHFSRSKT
ncbi:MAG: hypothetical protein V7723_19625 [Sneathiella sp.]|uniref:hypothetical protein n=1 Tax=Sneathiella sp. TaxID=1964365 RepID=UPI003001FD6D